MKSFNNYTQPLIRFFIVLLLIGMVVTSSKLLQKHLGLKKTQEKLLYIPSGKYLKPLTLGYFSLVADMLWLKAISYFGGHALTDRQYPWLPNLLEAIVDLDPMWEFPYHFAGIILSVEGHMIKKANVILRKGMENHPDIWQFPFYLGFNYFHELNNQKCGAKFIFRASVYPDSPIYLKALAARLSNRGNTRENHIALCNRLLNMTTDKEIKKQIKKNCEEKLKNEEFLNTLTMKLKLSFFVNI